MFIDSTSLPWGIKLGQNENKCNEHEFARAMIDTFVRCFNIKIVAVIYSIISNFIVFPFM